MNILNDTCQSKIDYFIVKSHTLLLELDIALRIFFAFIHIEYSTDLGWNALLRSVCFVDAFTLSSNVYHNIWWKVLA